MTLHLGMTIHLGGFRLVSHRSMTADSIKARPAPEEAALEASNL